MVISLKRLLLLIVAVCSGLLTSCGVSNTPPVFHYSFYNNSDWNGENRVAGNKIAFLFNKELGVIADATDQGGNISVRFTIDPSITEFDLKDSAMTIVKMYQAYHCFCGAHCWDTLPIHYGSISGKKLNNNRWHIKLDAIQINTYDQYQDTCHRTTIEHDFELDN